MESPPAENQTTGAQIPSALRQRMLKRAATLAESSQPVPPTLERRRSSLLSNLSDAQYSFRSSTDNLLRTNTRNAMDTSSSSDEPTYWHSSPIVFAIVPAIAAISHKNGGAFATDILLLLLTCWFMRLCVVTPWEWYHNAQQRQYTEVEDPISDDTIVEEDGEDPDSPVRPDSAKSFAKPKKQPSRPSTPVKTETQESARKELRREELFAFAGCFLGPLIGAYLLHTIRSQLTSVTRDGIISDLNLTIFVLAAEVRPVSRLVRMKNERTLHLQRVVRADPRANLKSTDANEISQRIAELEARMCDPMRGSNAEMMRVNIDWRQSMQGQLDALNRAVRKYEKRNMALSFQIEARFQELDLRLKDTLSLAAAAARTGQRPGIIAMTVSWIAGLVNHTLQLVWDVALYPWRIAALFTISVRSLVFGVKTTPTRKSAKGPSNGYSSTPASKLRSKGST